MPLTVSNFVLGPLIAFAVIGALAGLLRWMFSRQPPVVYGSPDEPERQGVEDPMVAERAVAEPMVVEPAVVEPAVIFPPAEDYGLLRAAMVTGDAESAESARATLTAAGIKATVATGTDGRVRVLVFGEELHRARRVMG